MAWASLKGESGTDPLPRAESPTPHRSPTPPHSTPPHPPPRPQRRRTDTVEAVPFFKTYLPIWSATLAVAPARIVLELRDSYDNAWAKQFQGVAWWITMRAFGFGLGVTVFLHAVAQVGALTRSPSMHAHPKTLRLSTAIDLLRKRTLTHAPTRVFVVMPGRCGKSTSGGRNR